MRGHAPGSPHRPESLTIRGGSGLSSRVVSGTVAPQAGWWLFVRRVLRRRCPQCGEGRLFRAFARLERDCSACGLVYRREQGAQTGAMYLTAAVNELFAVAVLLFLWFVVDWSVVQSLVVGLSVVLAFSVAFLPYSMALWVAIEYWTDVHNGESWTSPRP